VTITALVGLIGALVALIAAVSNALMNRAKRAQLYAEIEARRQTDREQNQGARDVLQGQLERLIVQITETNFGMMDLLQKDLRMLRDRLATEHEARQVIVDDLQKEIADLRAAFREVRHVRAAGPRRLHAVNGDD
jgi:hypothetical protein